MATDFLKELQSYFNTKNLYEVLNLQSNCKESEIKKAYYKTSLSCHPDKVSVKNRTEATERFKLISKAYKILSNAEERKIYDETGCINEEDTNLECDDWSLYWRSLFPKITVKDIDKYMDKYRDSEEEIIDLTRIYTKHCGDMEKILEEALDGDEVRLSGIIDTLIENGDVENFEAYSNEPAGKKKKRASKAAKEAKESEKILAELKNKSGSDQDASLENMILKNSHNRRKQSENFLDQLALKYSF